MLYLLQATTESERHSSTNDLLIGIFFSALCPTDILKLSLFLNLFFKTPVNKHGIIPWCGPILPQNIVFHSFIIKYLPKKKVTLDDLKQIQTPEIIASKYRFDEEKILRDMRKIPLDYVLSKYTDGDWFQRSICYKKGIPEMEINYPTAYSLALDLGEDLFSTQIDSKKHAEKILKNIVRGHSDVLKKELIYKDISACARAISVESEDIDTNPILKNRFIRIAELADKKVKEK